MPQQLPPALRRWSHNWRATSAIHHRAGCHRPCAGGATTGVLQTRFTTAQAATGLVPVEPQLACYKRDSPPPGCHRPCAGGATTGVLQTRFTTAQAATGLVPVEPQLACYKRDSPPHRLPPALCRWSHNWRATSAIHHRTGCHRPCSRWRAEAASKCRRFDGPRSARPCRIGLHRTLDCTCGCAAAFVQGWHRWPFQGPAATSHWSPLLRDDSKITSALPSPLWEEGGVRGTKIP